MPFKCPHCDRMHSTLEELQAAANLPHGDDGETTASEPVPPTSKRQKLVRRTAPAVLNSE